MFVTILNNSFVPAFWPDLVDTQHSHVISLTNDIVTRTLNIAWVNMSHLYASSKCDKSTQFTFKDFSVKLFTSDTILLNHIPTLVLRVGYWPSMDIILPSSLTQQ